VQANATVIQPTRREYFSDVLLELIFIQKDRAGEKSAQFN
jgi:hypothetical protein